MLLILFKTYAFLNWYLVGYQSSKNYSHYNWYSHEVHSVYYFLQLSIQSEIQPIIWSLFSLFYVSPLIHHLNTLCKHGLTGFFFVYFLWYLEKRIQTQNITPLRVDQWLFINHSETNNKTNDPECNHRER